MEDGTYGIKHHNYLRGPVTEINWNLKNSKNWHFQKDRAVFIDIQPVFLYIERHDESKKLEEKGIAFMPSHTRNQRKWIRDARNRQRKNSVKRVYDIFDQIAAARLAKG